MSNQCQFCESRVSAIQLSPVVAAVLTDRSNILSARNDFMHNKNPPATHHVWPRCIYAGYTGTAKNPKVGLLRSNLMIRVSYVSYSVAFRRPFSSQGAKAVLFSPSEAEGDGDARATRPSFAEINDITEVTRAFLAYVAVLVSTTRRLRLVLKDFDFNHRL